MRILRLPVGELHPDCSTAHRRLLSSSHSSEPTKHGSVAPVHRLGWGQRGLLGALSGDAGRAERRQLGGRARGGRGADRFGGGG